MRNDGIMGTWTMPAAAFVMEAAAPAAPEDRDSRTSKGRRLSVDKAKAASAAAARGAKKVVARIDKGVRSLEDLVLEPEEGATPKKAAPVEEEEAPLLDLELTVVLARNDRGLGLVFDSQFVVTKMLPGCAAREQGEIEIGDRLVAVDGVELHLGDSIATLFPLGDQNFELQLRRTQKRDKTRDKRRRIERVKKEPSGKYHPGRPCSVFE